MGDNALEVIGTQLLIAAVSMQAFDAFIGCILTWIKILAVLFPSHWRK